MKGRSFPKIVLGLVMVPLLVSTAYVVAGEKKAKTTVCSNPHPDTLCTAANTCGSKGAPCVLEVKRDGGGTAAAVTTNVPNFPKGSVICINPGTTVTWTGSGKNTGVVVDFGATSPFEPGGTIMAGSDRPINVVAKKSGCFKYTVGACTPGAIYGMCGNSDLELIVTGSGN